MYQYAAPCFGFCCGFPCFPISGRKDEIDVRFDEVIG